MEKISIVKQIQGTGTWNNFYKFEVTFENGDTGTMFKKTDNPYLNVGEQVKYEIEEKKAGHFTVKVKEKIRSNSETHQDAYKEVNHDRLDFERKKQVLIIRQSSLQRAIEFVNFFGSELQESASPKMIKDLAEDFTNYVIYGLKGKQ